MRVMLTVGFALCALAMTPSVLAECDGEIVPFVSGTGEDSCQYRHIPYNTFVYQNNKITATWDARYEIQAMYVLADFGIEAVYVPGATVPINRDGNRYRYDFAGYVLDTSTQEELFVITPMWCRSVGGEFINSPTDGCLKPSAPDDSCTDEVTCADGTHVEATCTGDSCSTSCGNAAMACCSSTIVETTTYPSGTVTTSTTSILTQTPCPEDPGGE